MEINNLTIGKFHEGLLKKQFSAFEATEAFLIVSVKKTGKSALI